MTIRVAPATDLVINPATLTDGTFGTAYSASLSATGGDGSYVFALSGGALPAGITLSGDGVLSGTPSDTGTFNFTASVLDGQNNSGTRDYALTIDPVAGLIEITPPALPQATFGVAAGALTDAPRAQSATAAPYYLRMMLQDKPGALARIATVLGEAGISIDRMRQYGHTDPDAPVLIVTHKTTRATLDTALAAMPGTGVLSSDPVAIRIEEV